MAAGGVIADQPPSAAEVFGMRRRPVRPKPLGKTQGAGRPGILRDQPVEQAGDVPGQESGVVRDHQIGPEGTCRQAERMSRTTAVRESCRDERCRVIGPRDRSAR